MSITADQYHIFDRAKVLILVGLSRRGINFPDFQLLIRSDIFLIRISPFFVLVWLKLAKSLTPRMSRCSEIVRYFRGISFFVQFFQDPRSSILHFWEVGSLCSWHPLACSKSVTALSIILNFFFSQIASFTSSQ